MKRNDIKAKYILADMDDFDHREAAIQIGNGPIIRENFPKDKKNAVNALIEKVQVKKKKVGQMSGPRDKRPIYLFEYYCKGKKLGEARLHSELESNAWISKNIKSTLYYVGKDGKKQKSTNYIHTL